MNGAHRSYVYLAPPSAPLSGANRSESSIAFDDRPNGSNWAEGSQLSERRTIRGDRDEFPIEGRRGPLPHFAHLRLGFGAAIGIVLFLAQSVSPVRRRSVHAQRAHQERFMRARIRRRNSLRSTSFAVPESIGKSAHDLRVPRLFSVRIRH